MRDFNYIVRPRIIDYYNILKSVRELNYQTNYSSTGWVCSKDCLQEVNELMDSFVSMKKRRILSL